MKINTKIESELLNNADAFKGEFYNRFKLRHAENPLQLNESIAKNYLFPTFYGNVGCAIGIFLCSYEKAQRLMPHPDIKPVKMGRGRSLVVFSCYEYRDVLGVTPYNEIAMTIPIMVNPLINIPVLPMVLNVFKGFGYYCFSMPVTSLENQIRGEKIWGLPKVVQEINIENVSNACHVEAKEASGETYFELKVPHSGVSTNFDVGANLYTKKDNQFLQSATYFKGTFNVVKNMGLLFKAPQAPKVPCLKLGDGPSARALKELEIEENAFQFRYCSNVESCFDLPNQEFTSNIKFN